MNRNEYALRKVASVVLLPLIIFLWTVGWTLQWIGEQKMVSKTASKRQ
ncbi:MAG: hypothetical protein NWF06_01680 [Candidatus Bathyarchaeota archaeon]|nr:hypothetical protein [Candidatus Bathyarchaeum sp.]